MAAADKLEPFRCACNAVLLRANEIGLEQYCDHCKRRLVVPYQAIENKEALFRYLGKWRDDERSGRA